MQKDHFLLVKKFKNTESAQLSHRPTTPISGRQDVPRLRPEDLSRKVEGHAGAGGGEVGQRAGQGQGAGGRRGVCQGHGPGQLAPCTPLVWGVESVASIYSFIQSWALSVFFKFLDLI